MCSTKNAHASDYSIIETAVRREAMTSSALVDFPAGLFALSGPHSNRRCRALIKESD